jgi:hypothetical protein
MEISKQFDNHSSQKLIISNQLCWSWLNCFRAKLLNKSNIYKYFWQSTLQWVKLKLKCVCLESNKKLFVFAKLNFLWQLTSGSYFFSILQLIEKFLLVIFFNLKTHISLLFFLQYSKMPGWCKNL